LRHEKTLIARAGFLAAITFGGISLMTVDAAPITLLSPILDPFSTTVFMSINTLLPTITGADETSSGFLCAACLEIQWRVNQYPRLRHFPPNNTWVPISAEIVAYIVALLIPAFSPIKFSLDFMATLKRPAMDSSGMSSQSAGTTISGSQAESVNTVGGSGVSTSQIAR
jgi:hypothetical protein